MKARKPGPFHRRDGALIAKCVGSPREIYFHPSRDGRSIVGGKEATRLAAWLTRAAAWIKEGQK